MTIETWKNIGRLLENLVIFCLFIMTIAGTIIGNNMVISIGLIWLSFYAFKYVSLKRKLKEKQKRIEELEDVLERIKDRLNKRT